jgi:predicted HNH restriction endonuclease
MNCFQLFFSFFSSIGKETEQVEYERGYRSKEYCEKHGHTEFTYSSKYKIKCIKCQSVRKSLRKNRIRQELLKIHGNKCSVCSYDKCRSALQFHHIDPSQKEFEISESAYSLEKQIAEAKKCVLLCANCHAEVENEILKSKIELFYSKKGSEKFFLSR